MGFGVIFPNVPSSRPEPLSAPTGVASRCSGWSSVPRTSSAAGCGQERVVEAVLTGTWVCAGAEAGNCSPPPARSRAKRNINVSLVNLEKRPQRPQTKDYITTDNHG